MKDLIILSCCGHIDNRETACAAAFISTCLPIRPLIIGALRGDDRLTTSWGQVVASGYIRAQRFALRHLAGVGSTKPSGAVAGRGVVDAAGSLVARRLDTGSEVRGAICIA